MKLSCILFSLYSGLPLVAVDSLGLLTGLPLGLFLFLNKGIHPSIHELSDPPLQTENKETVVDLTRSSIHRSALVSSLPKINLPVFDGDRCDWPNWYGMFKALVHDQRLS